MTEKLKIRLDDVTAELCRRSLFDFLKEFWGEIIHDIPIWNWHIPFLCEELEKAVETVIRNEPKKYDFICNICPGTTKSTIVSIALPCWVWVNKPDAVILLNTISKTNALKFAQKRRDILTSDKFRRLFPDVALRSDSTALMTLKNIRGGEITQYTTKGRITGDHGHIRIDDDPMSYTDAISDSESERCIDGYKAFATRNKSLEKTVYIQVMQRLSERDTTQHALKRLTNVRHIVLPAKLNDKINPPELAEKYVNGYLDPIRLNEKSLQEIKRGVSEDEEDPMSDGAFEAQYMQDVEAMEGRMYDILMIEDFSNITFKDDYDTFTAIDPADDGTDPLGVIYATEIGDKYYVRKIIYNSRDSDVNLPKICNLHDMLNPIQTFVEVNGLGSVFAKRLKENGLSGLKPLNNSENKVGRIDAYKWVVQEYLVFDSEMDNGNEEYRLFMKHLKKLTKEGDKKLIGAADVATHLAKSLFKTKKVS